MRRKLAPHPMPRATMLRPVAPESTSSRTAYAAIMDRLRGRARLAVAMAPLVSILGTVAACGGAPPVDPRALEADAGTDDAAPVSNDAQPETP